MGVLSMRKIYLLIICCFLLLTLCSCNDIRIVEIDGVIWKSDLFNIVTTSNQLQVYHISDAELEGNSYYSDIVIDGENHSCIIGLNNGSFYVTLYDDISNERISYYGEQEEFIEGHYGVLKKVKNQEYIYMLEIDLIEHGQYYEYCIENDIEFPTKLTLYGYKIK